MEKEVTEEEPKETPPETPPEVEPEIQWTCVDHGVIEEPSEEKGRMFCPECHKILAKRLPPSMKEEKEPLKPPEIARRERMLDLLKEKLPKVYGIGKERAKAIVRGLDENPQLLDNPQSLWYHILMMCRGVSNLNTYQLNNTLQGILTEVGISPQQVQMPVPPGQLGQPAQFPPSPFTGFTPPAPEQPWQMYNPQQATQQQMLSQQMQQAQLAEAQERIQRSRVESQERLEQMKEEHDLRMKKLEKEVGSTPKREKEKKVPVQIGDSTVEVPANLAPFYILRPREEGRSKEIEALREKAEKEREKREEAERKSYGKDIQHLTEIIEKRPSAFEELQMIKSMSEELGYSRGGRSTLDVISEGVSKLDQRAKQGLQMVSKGAGEFKPKISRTPGERREKAKEIERRIGKGEELLEAEESLLEAASKVKSPQVGKGKSSSETWRTH